MITRYALPEPLGERRKLSEALCSHRILLEIRGASMGLSQKTKLDMIAYVDPIKYYNLPYIDKPEIAALIGRINWKYRDQGKHMMLMVPGRIGTSSPELGVPTAFSDISSFEVICEMAESRAGYNPELSYGSHIFQDLVEAQILYTAMFPGERTPHFCPDLLKRSQNIVSDLPQGEKWKDVVTLIDVSGDISLTPQHRTTVFTEKSGAPGSARMVNRPIRS